MARLFRDRWGLQAQNQLRASFGEVAARAGRQPLAIGGHNWWSGIGHWVNVSGFENGELVLANPGGNGPHFGQRRLDEAAFNQRGPFSMVWIDVDGVTGTDGPTDPVTSAAPLTEAAVPPVVDPRFIAASRFRVVRTDGVGVRVRERPFQEGGRRGAAPEGAVLDGAEHAWRQVHTDDGLDGWVADEYLDREGDRFRVVRTDGVGVRVRAQPAVDGGRLGAVAEGDLVSGTEHAWRQVRTGDGIVGWSASTYLDPVGAGDEIDEGCWTSDIGLACAAENYWDPDGQPKRRAAMEQFNQLPRERRRAIFELAMDRGLTAEGIVDPAERDHWKQAMRAVTLGGPDFPGECPDLNPFMLAGESGGVFRGGADPAFGGLNSSALGYFQFLSQSPIPCGSGFEPSFDYGHWRRYSPCPDDYSRQTEPVCQVREFIRAIRASGKHHGDPMSVVREKATPPHVWGP